MFLIISLNVLSQKTSKSKWGYDSGASIFPHFGYAWQGFNTIDVGWRLLTFGVHENFSLMTNAIIFKQNQTYASPEVKVRYFKPVKIKNNNLIGVGFECSVSYWTTKVLSTREHRITPEIGFGLGQSLHFCYGYNIPLSVNTISFISTNRISVRIILD